MDNDGTEGTEEKEEKLRIGDILLNENIITPEQLEVALLAQLNEAAGLPLGETCVRLKFLARQELRNLLKKYQSKIRIGELLLNMGLINEDQLEEALMQQSVVEGRLGETLTNLEYITEAELTEAISIQLGYPKIVPNAAIVDRSLFDGLNHAYLKANLFVPAFKEDGVLTIIMANPLNTEIVHNVRKLFKGELEFAIATPSDISSFIDRFISGVGLGDNIKHDGFVIGEESYSDVNETDNATDILNFIIKDAVEADASDIHIEIMEDKTRVRYRIDGVLQQKTDLPKSISTIIVSRLKILCKLDIAEKRRHQDGRVQARLHNKTVDLRVSTYASLWGESIVIRVLNRSTGLIDLTVLGFTPQNYAIYKKVLDGPSGIVLVTGPTGSGKTTTLYASIDYLNSKNLKIITVEDPIEYTLNGIVQGQVNLSIGHSHEKFIKAMLRQDPDVIMIGEVRDKVTAETVIDAALTGHKALTTFHTDDSTGALLRLMDMGIETFLISSTVVSVISQRLVRSLCVKCKEQYQPGSEELDLFRLVACTEENLRGTTFFMPKGCSYCRHTGYKGRVAIHELLKLNDVLRDDILNRVTSYKIRETARRTGHLVSLREDGFYKASKGITSLEEVARIAPPTEVDDRMPRDFGNLKKHCETEIAIDYTKQ